MEANQVVVFKTIDDYIALFPPEVKELLEQVRATIHKAAPEAEETISYQMPAFKFKGILVYFAGYKKHIGFYPGASGIAAHKKEISSYKNAKGSVQFPIGQPLPLDLISKIVRFRLQENREKDAAKSGKKK
jgi:uncharacterized protein YdhG (YjbR/CyaY superfamily)